MSGRFREFHITGTFHSSVIYATSVREARRAFHSFYKEETIIYVKVFSLRSSLVFDDVELY